jgi:hypothetical protein
MRISINDNQLTSITSHTRPNNSVCVAPCNGGLRRYVSKGVSNLLFSRHVYSCRYNGSGPLCYIRRTVCTRSFGTELPAVQRKKYRWRTGDCRVSFNLSEVVVHIGYTYKFRLLKRVKSIEKCLRKNRGSKIILLCALIGCDHQDTKYVIV